MPEEYIGMETSDRWSEHTPAEVLANDEVEFYWNLTIQADMTVAGQILSKVEKATRKWTITDIAVQSDFNIVRIEARMLRSIMT